MQPHSTHSSQIQSTIKKKKTPFLRKMDHLCLTGQGVKTNSYLKVVNISRARIYQLGRNENQDIRIVDNMISRQHARLRYFNNAWRVQDMNSVNKTYVNGTAIVPYLESSLGQGDVLQLGVPKENRDYKFELVICQCVPPEP